MSGPYGYTCATPSGLANLIANWASASQLRVWVTCTQLIAANLTVPANIELHIINGAMLQPASTKTLTILGTINAGPYQIFDLSAGGTIDMSLNNLQREHLFEWWMVPGGGDQSVVLNAMMAKTSQFGMTYRVVTHGVWNVGGGYWGGFGITLQFPLKMLNKISCKMITGNRGSEYQIVRLDDVSAGGNVPMVYLQCCQHCLVEGFYVNCINARWGIQIDGQSGVNGGTQISTNNEIAFCGVNNAGLHADFYGIYITPSAAPNNEFMVIHDNNITGGGSATAGLGVGISVGGNSNNHMHLLEHNTLIGLQYGIASGGWSAYRSVRDNFNACQTCIQTSGMGAPVMITFADAESCGCFLSVQTSADTSLDMANCRVSACGIGAVALIQIVGTPVVTIRQNYFEGYVTNSKIYSIPYGSSGGINHQSITIEGNSYQCIASGMPNANVLVRTGVSTATPAYEIVARNDLVSNCMGNAFEGKGALTIDGAGAITMTAPMHHINTSATHLQTINISPGGVASVVGLGYGPIILIADGGNVTVDATASILNAGVITQNKPAIGFADPVSGKIAFVYA